MDDEGRKGKARIGKEIMINSKDSNYSLELPFTVFAIELYHENDQGSFVV